MDQNTWIVEVNLNSIDPFEYRIATSGQMLKTNAIRTLCKAGGLSVKWEESNWIVVAIAHSEEEARQKAERLQSMTISEKEHSLATGKSLYLNL